MTTARQIVDVLLETDDQPDVNIEPDDVSPEAYLHGVADQQERDKREGKITPQTALLACNFWHRTVMYSDGLRHYQARRNGATQTWKSRPGEFRIPIKYGYKGYGEITHKTADEWSCAPLPDKPKPVKVKKTKPVVNPSSLMPPL